MKTNLDFMWGIWCIGGLVACAITWVIVKWKDRKCSQPLG